MTQEIQKKAPTEVAIPKARGFEEPIDKSDLLIPRAKKLEQMSPEVQDDGLKAGMIINSITKEVLPEVFTPIFFFKQWIRFNPRNDKDPNFVQGYGVGDIVYRTNNPEDERLKEDGVWVGDTPPKATAFLNFFSLFDGVDIPIIISFCNTSYKTGKSLLSLARFSGGDMFSKKYKLMTKKTQNDKGTFYVLDVKLVGVNEDTAQAEKLYDTFRGRDIEVHQESESNSVPF